MLILVWEFLYVSNESDETWLKIVCFISSILLSLIFIKVIFTLQTKYRPEMQDTENYQKIWMEKRRQELNTSKPLD